MFVTLFQNKINTHTLSLTRPPTIELALAKEFAKVQKHANLKINRQEHINILFMHKKEPRLSKKKRKSYDEVCPYTYYVPKKRTIAREFPNVTVRRSGIEKNCDEYFIPPHARYLLK